MDPAQSRHPVPLSRTHRTLITIVVTGAVIIAAIGFAGSYAAVRDLAEQKGFGAFSLVFPIGIDAGICVLLALDLLLTWIRIPFPLLRQTAWLLTAATIAFNGAAAWPDPLGAGMHAIIPVLFVVTIEAARHAIGRIADITADKHMEGVRLTRWLLSPIPTFRLWRRMKLWELRSYEQVIKLEQDRLIYQTRLKARYGRAWRRKAPIEALMPLRLAKYGVPLADTAPAGLAATGTEPALLPPNPTTATKLTELQLPTTPPPTAEHTTLVEQEWPQPHPDEQQPPHDSPGPSPWSAAPRLTPKAQENHAYDPTHVQGHAPIPLHAPAARRHSGHRHATVKLPAPSPAPGSDTDTEDPGNPATTPAERQPPTSEQPTTVDRYYQADAIHPRERDRAEGHRLLPVPSRPRHDRTPRRRHQPSHPPPLLPPVPHLHRMDTPPGETRRSAHSGPADPAPGRPRHDRKTLCRREVDDTPLRLPTTPRRSPPQTDRHLSLTAPTRNGESAGRVGSRTTPLHGAQTRSADPPRRPTREGPR
ncbi:DUF2637 domain-containing protein [Streptomyces sp. NPDC002133]|uniref:DUF2637 domain-containing protein n=1 Tax=Streptomyces sp. NPDC002133 TaxID=3154409 RepID=UPI0033220CEE